MILSPGTMRQEVLELVIEHLFVEREKVSTHRSVWWTIKLTSIREVHPNRWVGTVYTWPQ